MNLRKDNESCFFCRYDGVDSECKGVEVCSNFKPKPLDLIVEVLDCMPIGEESK
jgi:hypothetical protein